jgi:hypothetical protein
MISSSSSLCVERVGSVSVKNVTSKSGLTQPVHFVTKNAAFDLVIRAERSPNERDAVDLSAATLELSLVYDARAPPYKLVDFVAGKKVLTYSAAGITKARATLHVRLAVLSSQVEGALFRVQVDALLLDGTRHSVVSPPITVVSKPYLALRAEGQRGKPKPENKRIYEQVSKTVVVANDDDDAAATDATAEPSASARTRTVIGGGEVLSSLDLLRQEQLKQRRLLEQLLRNQQTQLSNPSQQTSQAPAAQSAAPAKRTRALVNHDDDDEDEDEDELTETDDERAAATTHDDDGEDDAVSQRVKRRRRHMQQQHKKKNDTDDDDDDNDNNHIDEDDDDEYAEDDTQSAVSSSFLQPELPQQQQQLQQQQQQQDQQVLSAQAPPPFLFSTSAFQASSLSLDKQLENAAENVAVVLSNYLLLHSEDDAAAIIRRMLPSGVINALAPQASASAAACGFFVNACPHELELQQLRKRDMLFGSAGLGAMDHFLQ